MNLRIEFDADGGAQLGADVADESDALVGERGEIHVEHDRDAAHGQQRRFHLAVESVPVALCRVAAVVAVAVGVVRLAVGVVDGVARLQLPVAVVAVVEAAGRVALFVAFVVLEQLPAAHRRRAVLPRRDAQRAVAAVKVAAQRVALLVADAVARFLVALIDGALDLLPLQVRRYGRFPWCGSTGSAREVGVVHLALLSVPCAGAVAVVLSRSVLSIYKIISFYFSFFFFSNFFYYFIIFYCNH